MRNLNPSRHLISAQVSWFKYYFSTIFNVMLLHLQRNVEVIVIECRYLYKRMFFSMPHSTHTSLGVNISVCNTQ